MISEGRETLDTSARNEFLVTVFIIIMCTVIGALFCGLVGWVLHLLFSSAKVCS